MSPGSPFLNGTKYQLPSKPGNLIDPVSLKLMQYYPLPNEGVGTASYNPYTNWIGSGSNQGTNNQYDIKIDHRFSDKDLVSVKYSRQGNSGHGFNCFGNIADPCTSGPNTSAAHLAAVPGVGVHTRIGLDAQHCGRLQGSERGDTSRHA
jgi:hypothetical protein